MVFVDCLLTVWFAFLEIEAAQKAAPESQTPSTASVARTSLSEDEPAAAVSNTTEPAVAPTPDYAAGLLPSNPPPATPVASTGPLSSITSVPALKEPAVTRVVMMPSVRPPAPINSIPSMTTPAQVVRLVTAQPATGTSLATPTVYRLVQPAASVGQPVAATAAAASQPPAAPQKKSVALMLTVSILFSIHAWKWDWIRKINEGDNILTWKWPWNHKSHNGNECRVKLYYLTNLFN